MFGDGRVPSYLVAGDPRGQLVQPVLTAIHDQLVIGPEAKVGRGRPDVVLAGPVDPEDQYALGHEVEVGKCTVHEPAIGLNFNLSDPVVLAEPGQVGVVAQFQLRVPGSTPAR